MFQNHLSASANQIAFSEVALFGKASAWTNIFRNRISYHIILWLCLYLFNTIYIGFIIHNFTYSFFDFSVKLPFLLAICYFNIYFLLPRCFLSGNYIKYAFAIFGILLVLTVLLQIILNAMVYADYCPKQYVPDALFSPENTLEKMFSLSTIVIFTTGLKLSKDWFTHQQLISRAETQNLKTELDYLKMQIRPHFYFNTLNNLYALTLKKSDLAPEVVLKLADMMSYVLYESDGDRISLTKEIEHIQNYVGLEQLRFKERLEYSIGIDGDIDQVTLPPLLLLPFVENSLKHGTQNDHAIITISLLIKREADCIWLITENPIPRNQETRKKGVGLRNVIRRLDLLYQGKYQLSFGAVGSVYRVELKIPTV